MSGGGFVELLVGLASRPDDALGLPWRPPGRTEGRPLAARDAYHAILRAEQMAAAAAPPPAGEAQAIVDLAQAAFGDLRGLLAGLSELDLDRIPGEGEWPVREVLGHILLTERRFAFHVRHALSRESADPVYIDPDLSLPASDLGGDPAAWIERLGVARAQSLRFREIDAAGLERPSVWAGFEIDVRFRLHRFAEHLAEHTIHIQKQLQMEAVPVRESVELARRISTLRGRHELRTPAGELLDLDQRQARLEASIPG